MSLDRPLRAVNEPTRGGLLQPGNVSAEKTNTDPVDSRHPNLGELRADSLEARASIVLKALALINIAGMVFAMLPTNPPASVLHAVAFNLAAGGLAALEIVEARGLDHRRPWAVAAVRPLLVLLVASGIAAILVGSAEGLVRVPFESAFAIWALLGTSDVTLLRRTDRRSVLLVGAALLLMVSVPFGKPVFGWGGLLDVRQSDLHASIDADCGPSGAGLPETITVTYDWSWARPGLLSSGLDIVVLGWSMIDAVGRPIYLFDKGPDGGPGIYAGRREYPSIDMATQAAKDLPASRDWGIDLGEQGLRPGRVELQLHRVRDAPSKPTPLVLTATYVHLGVWRSDPITVNCSW